MSNNLKRNRLGDTLLKYGLYIVLVLLILFFTLCSKKFLTISNMLAILQGSAALGIVTVGMSLVILTGGIDISVGSVMYLSIIVAGIANNKAGAPIGWSILLGMAAGAVAGAFNGVLIGILKITPFVATLATMGICRGLGQVLNDGKAVYFQYDEFISGNTLGIPNIVYIWAVILILGQFMLSYTQFGRQLYAVGNDKIGAEKIGISIAKRQLIVYLISGVLAALGGCLAGIRVGIATSTFADGEEFTAISSAVIGGISLAGGRGRLIPDAIIGIIIIQMIFNGLVIMNASPYFQTVFKGIVIFVAVLADSIKNGNKVLQ